MMYVFNMHILLTSKQTYVTQQTQLKSYKCGHTHSHTRTRKWFGLCCFYEITASLMSIRDPLHVNLGAEPLQFSSKKVLCFTCADM